MHIDSLRTRGRRSHLSGTALHVVCTEALQAESSLITLDVDFRYEALVRCAQQVVALSGVGAQFGTDFPAAWKGMLPEAGSGSLLTAPAR